MTYADALKEADRLLDNKAPSTKSSYMSTLQRFRNFPTRSAVVSVTAEWRGAGLSPASIRQKYCAIRWMASHFLRYFDPIDMAEMLSYMKEIKVPPSKTSVATPEQVKILLRNASQRTALAIGLMFYHGLRVSDVAGLCVDDFQQTSDGIVLSYRDEKTKKLHEHILLPQVEPLLRNYLHGDRAKNRDSSSAKVFLGERGETTKHTIQTDVSSLCDYLGMPELHCHSFRHGCGTAYAKAGVGVEYIQNVLGHKSISSSQRYIHLAKEDVYEKSKGVF